MNIPAPPQLLKASLVVGKTLSFRNATVFDAAFILSLRTDMEKSRYLSAVSGDLVEQQTWLESYAHAQDQAYFIIEFNNTPIGTVRLYDPQGESFCWGSWILHNSRPSHAAVESALMVYAYAVDHLGFSRAHFNVSKGNERVWQFHERFGAKRASESSSEFFYKIELEAIKSSQKRFGKFLAETVSVQSI